MAEEIIYSLVVHDVSVTMHENTIKSELMETYNGIAEVTRMYFNDEEETPKTSVQVDFTSPNDVEKILRDGTIVLGGICRRVYALKRPTYQRSFRRSPRNQQNTTKRLCEQDLINMFEEQKKLLTNIMNSFEDKLNNALTPRQDKIAQPILSSNAS